jgi:SAM-dependent methyltransferase
MEVAEEILMPSRGDSLAAAELLMQHVHLFSETTVDGPVLDLACGDGHNGVFLARMNLSVICCDVSRDALRRATMLADKHGVNIEVMKADLEREDVNPLREEHYRGIIVFRYLHRPLMPCVRKSLQGGGILIYETFTIEQVKYGKPRNPNFLLRPGELRTWFSDWDIIHYFEGIKENPQRAVAQLVCRKPI